MEDKIKEQITSAKRVLDALKEARAKIETLESAKREPIAIVGMGCRFPGGSNTIDAYWQFLRDGRDGIVEIPPYKWPVEQHYSADHNAQGKIYITRGGFLTSVDEFDANFFRMSPREAISLDPQQRLVLEVAWEALENAAIVPDSLYGSNTGVFIGIGQNDYARFGLTSGDLTRINTYDGTGNLFCFASGRLSYVLGLHGPALSVDTACSSSLVAVHLACQSLRRGECSTALAGGVHLVLSPEMTVFLSRSNVLSPDGRCKTFDAAADGFSRGEGCGMVVLKRLSDALSDGDNVLALIRGSALNQDGPSSGLTVPNEAAQERVIQSALLNAAVEASDVSYIEAHGTGTSLGDPIEVGALGAVFKAVKTRSAPLVIGSVKTNFGHLEAAAGVAGLIKVVLSMQHGTIPPHLHFKSPNPHIDWQNLPIEVASEGRAWHGKKIAGVSSFGFSGTNAHIVLEEAPVSKPVEAEFRRPVHILTFSAKTEESLKELAVLYKEMLSSNSDISVSDICNTSNIGRSHFSKRGFAIGGTAAELLNGLAATQELQLPEGHPKVAFLFTGQGGLSADMGRGLYESSPVFRDTLAKCDTILRRHMQLALLELMYGGASAETLNETRYAQPVLFSLEYSLYELWRSWGIAPGAVIGHSIGEYTAACAAGVFSLEDALMLIAERGRLMSEAPGDGAMAAVFAGEAPVLAFLSEDVSIAAVNGPDSVVISGQRDSVKNVCVRLTEQGIKHKELQVSHGFHSKLMDPVLDKFAEMASRVTYNKGIIPVVSNVTGEYYRGAELCADYWVRHLRSAVRFSNGIETLYKDGYRIFLELGPNAVLLGMGSRCVEGAAWLPSLRAGQDDWRQILKSLGSLYIRGVDINWKVFNAPYGYKKPALPTYPFARKRYWIDKPESSKVLALSWKSPGERMRLPMSKEVRFSSVFSAASPSFVKDHRVFGRLIVAGASHISMVIQGLKEAFGLEQCTIYDVFFSAPLIIDEMELTTVQLIIEPHDDTNTYSFKLISQSVKDGSYDDSSWITHLTGKAAQLHSTEPLTGDLDVREIRTRCQEAEDSAAFYGRLRKAGFDLGQTFRWNREIWFNKDEILCSIGDAPFSDVLYSQYQLYPGLLDSAFQLLSNFWKAAPEDESYVPFRIADISFYGRPSPEEQFLCYAAVSGKNDDEGTFPHTKLLLSTTSGKPVAMVNGFEFRRANTRTLFRDKVKSDSSSDQWLYEIKWIEQAAQTVKKRRLQGQRFLIFNSAPAIFSALSEMFQKAGAAVTLVSYGEELITTDHHQYVINNERQQDYIDLFSELKGQDITGVVFFAGIEENRKQHISISDIRHAQSEGALSLAYLVAALIKANMPVMPRLFVVTRGAQIISEKINGKMLESALGFSTIWGMAHVPGLEAPALKAGFIDLDPVIRDEDVSDLFYQITGAQMETHTAFRGGLRYVARLSRVKPVNGGLKPDSDATYIITGGLGALGLELVAWLVEKGARHLALTGRSSAGLEAREIISGLESQGVSVAVISADVTVPEDVERLFSVVGRTMPRVKGIFHAAGVLADSTIINQNAERFQTVMGPKVYGTWNLHQKTAGMKLDFFVCFSSAAAMIGSIGQSNYAAANAFMDTLMRYRRNLGLPGLSVNWGAWAEVGMASRLKDGEKARLHRQGHGSIALMDGFKILEGLIADKAINVGVLPIDWGKYETEVYAGEMPPFFDLVRVSTAPKPSASVQNFSDELKGLPEEDQIQRITARIREQVAAVLAMESPQDIGVRQRLFDAGIDSLMAIELKNRLETGLKMTLPATLVFDYPTVEALSGYICRELGLLSNRAVVDEGETKDEDLDSFLDDIDTMSDEELMRKFRK